MKTLLRITLAASVFLAGSGFAHADEWRGERDGRHVERHSEYRGEAQRGPEHHEGWDHHAGWERHHDAEYHGYGGPAYIEPVYAEPVYAEPVYAEPVYGYAQPVPVEDDGNVAGAVIAGAVVTGVLAAILLHAH